MVCVNLMDEAAKNRIRVDLEGLEAALGVPVSGTNARRRQTLGHFLLKLDAAVKEEAPAPFFIAYDPPIEAAISIVQPLYGTVLPPALSQVAGPAAAGTG